MTHAVAQSSLTAWVHCLTHQDGRSHGGPRAALLATGINPLAAIRFDPALPHAAEWGLID